MASQIDQSSDNLISLFPDTAPIEPVRAIKVLLVDDQAVFRSVARSVLERDGDCSVVGEAGDGANAIEMVGRVNPDVVVIDVQMSEMDGLEATRRILARHPGANVVLTSMGSDSEYPALAREIGAKGFLPKRHLNPQTLRDIIGGGPDDEPRSMAA